MSEWQPFLERIEAKLREHEEWERGERADLERKMSDEEEQAVRFRATADRIFTRVIEPRLKLLVDKFKDARYAVSSARHHGTVSFNSDNRFPARIKLHLGVADDPGDFIRLEHRAEIIPGLVDYEREDARVLSIDAADDAAAAEFFEGKIIAFVDAYLRVKKEPAYNKDNLATDPVCGMTVNRLVAPASFDYDRKTYYFCAKSCYERFVAEPKKYA